MRGHKSSGWVISDTEPTVLHVLFKNPTAKTSQDLEETERKTNTNIWPYAQMITQTQKHRWRVGPLLTRLSDTKEWYPRWPGQVTMEIGTLADQAWVMENGTLADQVKRRWRVVPSMTKLSDDREWYPHWPGWETLESSNLTNAKKLDRNILRKD